MRLGFVFHFALAVLAAGAVPPEQPIPFSHLAHAGDAKLPCKMCHANPDPGEMMTIATASQCMQCHSAIKADSPAIAKLAVAAKDGREIKWVRLYRIPSYVKFSHRDHMRAGNSCQECHGEVASRDRLAKEGDISMGGCMNCHRMKKATLDCASCHEPIN